MLKQFLNVPTCEICSVKIYVFSELGDYPQEQHLPDVLVHHIFRR